jgi:hypothetical protein
VSTGNSTVARHTKEVSRHCHAELVRQSRRRSESSNTEYSVRQQRAEDDRQQHDRTPSRKVSRHYHAELRSPTDVPPSCAELQFLRKVSCHHCRASKSPAGEQTSGITRRLRQPGGLADGTVSQSHFRRRAHARITRQGPDQRGSFRTAATRSSTTTSTAACDPGKGNSSLGGTNQISIAIIIL